MARGIESEFIKITPTRAAELLANNGVNRRLRPQLVGSYAEDMAQGLWRATGEAIKVSRTGRLLDGQHRLNAVIEFGKPIEMLVVTGLPDDAQELMDQGAARSAADALAMHGFQYVTLTAGVARWLLLAGEPGEHMEQALKKKSSVARVLKTAQENLDVATAAAQYPSLQHHVPGSPTALCYTWLWLSRTDASACDEFWQALIEMNFYPAGRDPRKAGLRALQRMDRDEGIGGASKDKAIATVSVLTRTWNFWRKREDIDSLQIRNTRGQIIPPVHPV